jgi:hypothetical protein
MFKAGENIYIPYIQYIPRSKNKIRKCSVQIYLHLCYHLVWHSMAGWPLSLGRATKIHKYISGKNKYFKMTF